MQHRIKGRKFGRDGSHRRSLYANLASAIIKHEQVKTTLPKAKEIRAIVEKLITLGKKGSLAHRRKAISFLYEEEIVRKLFDVLGKRYADRKGGYVRILKAGFRYGDSAPMAIIELVDRDVTALGKNSGPVLVADSEVETSTAAA